MGLAASQARFLGLTARKSNAEYQAQQINQQRTALSNEVARINEDYNKLEVPVPPSKTDYVKTTYTLEDTDENYQISNYEKITDTSDPNYGKYNLILSYEDSKATKASYTTKTDSTVEGTRDAKGNLTSISKLSFIMNGTEYKYDSSISPSSDANTLKYIQVTEANYDEMCKNYVGLSTIMGDSKTGNFFTYTKDGKNYYTSEDDVKTSAYTFNEATGIGTYSGSYTFDYQGSIPETKQISAIGTLSTTSDGRLSTVKITSCDDDKSLVDNIYTITVGQQDDEAGYEDASNDYKYKKDLYEKKIDEINLKTKKLQQQDQQLELKLNQIDTEQNALKTEMDSVKKVIEDTIESVFKTFNG